MNCRKHFLALTILVVLCMPNLSAENVQSNSDESTGLREEIQRYFGYEELLYRYVTLPYDLNSNTNQQGTFVDLGYLLLAILPLIILSFLSSKRWVFYLGITIFILYLFIGFRYSFIQDINNNRYNPAQGDLMLTYEVSRWDGWILQHIYQLAGWIINPIVDYINTFKGVHGKITYPFMFLIFAAGLFGITKTKVKSDSKFIAMALFGFGFLWWLLSGGIIWYGYLMIPIGLMFIFKGMNMNKDLFSQSIIKWIIGISIFIWMIMAVFLRISSINMVNYATTNDHSQLGKHIVEPRIFPHTIGNADYNSSLELLSKNLSIAIHHLNRDDGKIYKAGTSLDFDIKNNNFRIIEDNSLSYFKRLVDRHQTRTAVTEEFKRQEVKYILLDLMMPTLDRTPEKTLTEKYVTIINFLRDNAGLNLITTDRLVRSNRTDGSKYEHYHLTGDEYLIPGTFILYEVI